MIKIPTDSKLLPNACNAHFQAILAYVKKRDRKYREDLFQAIGNLIPQKISFKEVEEKEEWKWLSDFILADVKTLREFVKNEKALQFDAFLKIYNQRFCSGISKYVDDTTKYNAYSFIKNIGITVCPYCEEEFLDVLESKEKGTIRTIEIDHFFPKSEYPGLAMCFFNLVPSGENCNGIKLQNPLGMNPYEGNIESCTWLYPDLPIGINMENVSVEDCKIKFHPKQGMELNVSTLRLEERYDRHKATAHRYLTIKQQYDDAKILEMVKCGFFESEDKAYRILYGEPLQDDGQQQILQKLKRDITRR